jgi:hypothetical protein
MKEGRKDGWKEGRMEAWMDEGKTKVNISRVCVGSSLNSFFTLILIALLPVLLPFGPMALSISAQNSLG